MNVSDRKCDTEVFEKGTSVCLLDIPKDAAEALCKSLSATTGYRIDWHYIGGRVHVKALPPAAPDATACPGHGRSECVSCCWPKHTWNGLRLPPVGLPVEAYFPQDTQPVWLETTLLYVSDENVIYDDPGHGEIRKTRAEFDDLKVQFRAVKS